MINEETQRKLRNMKMEPLVEALQNQQSDLESYAPLDFDSRLTLAIDECYSVNWMIASGGLRILLSSAILMPMFTPLSCREEDSAVKKSLAMPAAVTLSAIRT